MSMVMFAMLCDQCGVRGAEYTAHYTCRECLMDVCKACSADHDDETMRATCHACVGVAA